MRHHHIKACVCISFINLNFNKEFHSSSDSSPGMYSKLTSNTTGLFGATRGLPGAETRPFGNANL